MRDGEEDYEYLTTLENLVKANPTNKNAQKKANQATQHARTVTTDLVQYEMDQSKYEQVREEVAAAVEGLIR